MALAMPNFMARFVNMFSTSSMASFAPRKSADFDKTARKVPEGSVKATLAAGCFWGVEHMFAKEFKGKGLHYVRSGYIGGVMDNPYYNAVCSGSTGHAEAVQITYDPKQIEYSQLLEYFYKMHDPTTENSQGPDRGAQYRSAIFYHNSEQEKTARDITKKVNEQWWKGQVVTQILDGGEMNPPPTVDENGNALLDKNGKPIEDTRDVKIRWYDAETKHQEYLDKNPSGYECPSHFLRRFPPLS